MSLKIQVVFFSSVENLQAVIGCSGSRDAFLQGKNPPPGQTITQGKSEQLVENIISYQSSYWYDNGSASCLCRRLPFSIPRSSASDLQEKLTLAKKMKNSVMYRPIRNSHNHPLPLPPPFELIGTLEH